MNLPELFLKPHTDIINEIFDSFLKNFIYNYEKRTQQVLMSNIIYESFLKNHPTIIEAPTGLGKSLAYIIPSFIYLIKNNNYRVIISTFTKTLQQQLIKKDLPLVSNLFEKTYGENIKYTSLYGSENYICLDRFFEFKKSLVDNSEVINLFHIEEWLVDTDNGCVEEIDIDDEIWQEINRQKDLCQNIKCRYYHRCFYYKHINNLKNFKILVVNHYLFFTNIFNFFRLIPINNSDVKDIIIFDEAHNLENVILNCLGHEISNTQIKFLCNQIYNTKKQRGLITKLSNIPKSIKKEIIILIYDLIAAAGQFFSQLSSNFNNKKEIRIFNPYIVEDVLTPILIKILDLLRKSKEVVSTDEEFFKIDAYIKRIINFIYIISSWLKCEDLKNYVYWAEKEQSKNVKIYLRITPLDIKDYVQDKVYSLYDKIIFTSATLSVNNKFDFFKKSIGLISNTKEIVFDSPFEFENNVLLYLPEDIPNPKNDYDSYKYAVAKIIFDLINLTHGNTFVLFTSFELMNWVYKNIKSSKNILLQKESKYKLIEKYKKNKNSVLFGVDTFWYGVDIPGEKLISIIIPKLPFDVPENPLIEAKSEKIRLEGNNPFTEYILPHAILKLKQGFGRLIRSKSDWGIVSILDPRLRFSWYGKYFLMSLPKCKITSDFRKVENFFQERCLILNNDER